MQLPLKRPPQPEPENRCPDCLFMKLSGTPVKLEKTSDSLDVAFEPQAEQNEAELIELHLTINFNEQWIPLNGGRVKFGLKGGELKLKLEEGLVSYDFYDLTGSTELAIHEERQEQEGIQDQNGMELSWSDLVLSVAGSKAEPQANVSHELIESITDKFEVTGCQVTTKVSQENPAWSFQREMGNPVLKGSLKNALLATLNVIAFPCRVEATFEVSKRDVHLTDAEGLWPPDISHHKRSVLKRLIVLRMLEPKLKPYLSRQELQYD